ncbi:Hypothetical_protein [Hexamita inflata]|uniref:Hypothetical_protein n=1 Tax=Hexamita inflata TaxID=28002 RepID=A0AA86P3W5_9EUKA|nr:Hypothetical protein HINF_LOCUS17604 [Hexamita inflata]
MLVIITEIAKKQQKLFLQTIAKQSLSDNNVFYWNGHLELCFFFQAFVKIGLVSYFASLFLRRCFLFIQTIFWLFDRLYYLYMFIYPLSFSKFPFEETLRSIGAFQWSFDLVTFRLGAFSLSASERPQASFCQAPFLRYSSQVQLSNLLQSFSSRFQAGLRHCLSFK